MVNTFKDFYLEGKGDKKPPSKKIKLNVEEVTITLKDKEELGAQIEIFLNRDPNITGHVQYKNIDKAKMAYDNLKDLGSILNYMYYNMKNSESAHKWAHIVGVEVSAEKKKDLEEIEKDGLNFSIKSDMEREAEIQAKLMGAEEDPEGEDEAPPQMEKEKII